MAAPSFRCLDYQTNLGHGNASVATKTLISIDTYVLVLRPVDAAVGGGDSDAFVLAVLEGGRRGAREIAPKPVGTGTSMILVVSASAKCTVKEPFFPQRPQSGTSR